MRIILSGGGKCQRGVGIIFDKEVARRVTEMHQVSGRLITVKVSATPVDMAILQVYMPTTAYEDEDIEQIYEQIENIITKQKGNKNVIVMGDFNANMGEGMMRRWLVSTA